MIRRRGVVQVADGRVFDEECYECAHVRVGKDCTPGFYAVEWPIGAVSGRLDVRPTLIGPFPTAVQAEGASGGETS